MKRRLREQQIRTKIAADLHDDVGSALSSISIITQMVTSNLEAEKNSNVVLLRKATTSTRSIMDSMDDIVWSINPENDVFKSLEIKLKEFAFPLMESKCIHLTISFEKGLEQLKLDMEQRRDLYLIMKEALNNIAKYSKASKALLAVEQKDKQLHLHISDNGIGLEESVLVEHRGNGLKNIANRVASLKGKLNIVAERNQGTRIDIYFQV